jgi:hypothetical protein
MKNLIILFCLIFFSCDQIKQFSDSQITKTNPNLQISYFDNGSIKSEVRIDENGKKHGLSKSYFADGVSKTEIYYTHGVKDSAFQYHKNGNMYMIFFYSNGKKHGVRTKFWEDGKIQSTVTYKEGLYGIDLEEFNKRSEKLRAYPKLKVVQIDKLNDKGEYIIEAYFDKNSKRATYYIGDISGGFIDYKRLFKLNLVNGKGRFVYKPNPGGFIMEELQIVAIYKTLYRNQYVETKKIRVAFDY